MITISFDSLAELSDFVTLATAAAHSKTQLDRIEGLLNISLGNERTIIMNENEMSAALTKIDTATTKAGANIQSLADTTQTISDEVDALEAKLLQANVPQALVDQASALGDRLQGVSDALDTHATFLKAVATKGAGDPVPVPVPPAPPDTPPV